MTASSVASRPHSAAPVASCNDHAMLLTPRYGTTVGSEVSVTAGVADAGFTLGGDAVELVEALSFRVPLRQEIPSRLAWAFSGLAEAFDR